MKVLVTGSNGFIGSALCAALADSWQVIPMMRAQTGDIDATTNWQDWLTGCDVVVHLAARVHVPGKVMTSEIDEFRKINVEATMNLARQAAKAGVKRFVFLSSVMVHGHGRAWPYHETDMPRPEDAYGLSKWEAELRLQELAQQVTMEIIILRPPLVYGPGVKANFLRLMKAVARYMPLPLGCIENQRSLIYVGNLAAAIRVCMEHPAAAGKTYLVSDGEDVSTPELIRRLARAMCRPALLLSLPLSLCRLGGTLLGKKAEMDRLLGSLSVDSGAIRRELGWNAPYTMAQGLDATAAWYFRK